MCTLSIVQNKYGDKLTSQLHFLYKQNIIHKQDVQINTQLNQTENMIHSNKEKIKLCSMLYYYNPASFYSALRLQKFLFFYEAMNKATGEEVDFSSLKGYRNGPVFGTVYGDYTKEHDLFIKTVSAYGANGDPHINPEHFTQASYLTSILTEDELSDLTHLYDIWSCKKDRIDAGETHVALFESDFSEADKELTLQLLDLYPIEQVSEEYVLAIGDKRYVFQKDNYKKITEKHLDVLNDMKHEAELHNPVYVFIADDEVLEID